MFKMLIVKYLNLISEINSVYNFKLCAKQYEF